MPLLADARTTPASRTKLTHHPDRWWLDSTLREVEQLETAQICKILDVSTNTLGVLLFRARNALRDRKETGAADVEM